MPADGVGDDPADRRSDHGAQAEDPAHEALVLAALARVEHVPDHGERDWEECAGTETLDAAERDELPHLLGEAGEQRPDQEDRDREEKDWTATEEVGQLPVDRTADRGCEDVRGEGPRVDVVAMKVGDDLREGGAHHGLVKGREKQAKEDRGDDLGARARVHPGGHSSGNGLRHSGRSPIYGICSLNSLGPQYIR